MPSRIDDKTLVPLGIVVVVLSAVISATMVVSFWANKVDYRLSRIEDKLGIAQAPANGILKEAQAKEK